MGWVVSITTRPRFTPRERTPGIHCTGGWVGPRAGLDKESREKILCPCRESNPDRPVVQPNTGWIITSKIINFFLLFMSMVCDCVSELPPVAGLLFIPHAIYEHGEPRWNYIDRGKLNNSEKNLSQWYISHMDWWTDTSEKLGLSGGTSVTNRLSHGTTKYPGL
jgi:hypothetical protein